MLLVGVVAFAFVSLVLFRPGLLRRRGIAGVFTAIGIVAGLFADAVSGDPFLVASACFIPVLVGLLVQEMVDVSAVASSGRESRRRRVRERTRTERERARRERERQRLAA